MENLNDEVYEAESVVDIPFPVRDILSSLQWKMQTGELIHLADMEDKHIRNCALFLMNMGYMRCGIKEDIRIKWLTAFRMEWERRMAARNLHGFLVRVR